jgi:NAD(P)-dependent dehydrogenase (short-subunit alcohol dehydrogenase family)
MNLQELTALYDFSGKSIVITGGTGVIGGELACALTGCRASVTILSRRPALADRVLERIGTSVGKAIAVFGDVLSRDTLETAADRVTSEFGGIDALINAAGGNHPRSTTGPDLSFFDIPDEAFRFTGDLNLLGTILPSQVFGKRMAARKRGCILNVTSMAAVKPLTRVVAYSAAKAGVSNFTQWLAVYMATEISQDIRVNALAPGFFLTEQNRFLLTDPETGALTERGKKIIAHTPLGRFGSPEELVGTALWLLSPVSAFVTGAVIPVDGGFSAYAGV